MKPLTLAELTVNMEREGLHRLQFDSFDTLKHPMPTLDQTTKGKQECPLCLDQPRAAILFHDHRTEDPHWYAKCGACGHCERV